MRMSPSFWTSPLIDDSGPLIYLDPFSTSYPSQPASSQPPSSQPPSWPPASWPPTCSTYWCCIRQLL